MATSHHMTLSTEAEMPKQRSDELNERSQRKERSESSARKSFYYPALDSLRVFAMLAILVYHYAPHRLSGGFIGVDVFFVISGYLLTRTALGWREDFKDKYINFLARRIVRLGVPMLIVMLLVIAILNAFFPNLLYNLRASFLTSLLFFNNWWQIIQGASYFEAYAHPAVFTHLWYVAVTMQIAIIWPLLIRFLQKLLHNRRIIALACVVIAFGSAALMGTLYHTGADPSRVYYGTDTRLYAFALGSALGAMWSPVKMKERFGKNSGIAADIIAILSLGTLVCIALKMQDQSMWTYRGGLLVSAIVATIAVAALTISGGLFNRLMSIQPLAVLGKITFSVYLWYYPILTIGNESLYLSTHLWVQWVLLLFLSILTYIFVERRLLRHLIRRKRVIIPTPRRVAVFAMRRASNALAVLILLILVVSCGVGLVRSENIDNQTVEEMQMQIEANERMLRAKQAAADRHALDDIADIPYLNRSTMLYCRNLNVTFIGDSVLLAAAAPLSDVFPSAAIDGEVGRSLNYSDGVVDLLASEGRLYDVVVLVLGTNGPFTDDQLENLMSKFEGKQVFVVNTFVPRPWQNDVNEKLEGYANKSKQDNIHLIDWKSNLEQHPEWLYEDGVHPNDAGAEALTQLIAETLYDVLASDEQKEMDKLVDEAIAAEQATVAEATAEVTTEEIVE